MKQLAFPFTVVNQAAPRPGPFGGAEVVRKSRAQAAEFIGRARKTHVALEPVVHEEHRQDNRADGRASPAKIDQDLTTGHARPGEFDDGHHRDGDEKEIEVVAVRQALQHEDRRERRHPPSRTCRKIPVQQPQTDRHPAVQQHLEMGALGDPVWRDREGEPGQQRRVRAPPQITDEQEHPEAREHIRPDVGDVVGQDRVARDPFDRRREQGHRDQRFGVGQCVSVRVQKRRVPESVKTVTDPVGIPRQDEGVQQRIAEATDDFPGRRQDQRIGGDERNEQ